ncbi:17914_t:CDS:10 [Entrophospora sp. SA101]|nr:17914_t:CDS:10 [Entrophospora sp. SA101]
MFRNTSSSFYKESFVPLNGFTSKGSKVESIEYVLEPRSNEKPDKDYEEIFIEENNSVANQGSIHHTEANPTSYIAWRVVDSARVLELRQFLIPSKNIASNLNHISQPGDTTPVIRIKFSSIIVPNVGFITDPITRSLHCVLLLSSKMLYQLELPLDTLFTKRNLMEYYDVRAKVRSLKEKIPALVHVIDNENIIIGCTNGSVIHLKQTETIKKKPGFNKMDDCFDELEFKDNSYYKFMNNLLGARPMIFGGNNDQLISPLQPVSMDSYVCGTKGYIIYICRNRKVVICCLNTHSYISHDPLAEIRPQNDILELLGRDDNIAIHQITAEFDDNPLLPPNSRGYVRILNFNKHPSSFFFMVSVPTTFNCYFITYIVNVDTSGVLKDAKVAGVTSFNHYHKFDSNQSSNTKLIDMSLKFQQIYKPPPPPPPNEYQENQQVTLIEDEKLEYDCRLWALWEHDKQSVVSFVDFQVLYYPSRHNNRSSEFLFNNEWTIVAKVAKEIFDKEYLYTLQGVLKKDLIKFYLDYIFCPTRFSHSIIKISLKKYIDYVIDNLEEQDDSNTKQYLVKVLDSLEYTTNLKQIVRCAIARHILKNKNETTSMKSDLGQSIRLAWESFIEICHEEGITCRRPLSIYAGDLIIIKLQDGLSVIRSCEPLEVFQHSLTDDFETFTLTSNPYYRIPQYCLLDHQSSNITRVLTIGNVIAMSLPDRALLSIDKDLVDVLLNKENDHSEVRTILRIAHDKIYIPHMKSYLDDQTLNSISNMLRSIQNFETLIKPIFDLLHSLEYDASLTNIVEMKTTVFIDAVIASTITDILQTRYTISKSMFLLMVFLTCSQSEEHLKRLSISMSTLYTFIILKWISEQSAYKDDGNIGGNIANGLEIETSEDDVMCEKFSSLTVIGLLKKTNSPDLQYSFLHTLIRHNYPLSLNFQVGSLTDIMLKGVYKFLKQMNFIRQAPNIIVMTIEPYARFADLLENYGFLDHLYQFLEFLLVTPQVTFVWGKYYIKKQNYDLAKQHFIKAGSGFDNFQGDLTAYFQHVATIFENVNQLDYGVEFCKKALNAFDYVKQQTPEGQQTYSSLYTKIFNDALKKGLFDDAYSALTSNPNIKEALKQLKALVIGLCEKNETKYLSELSFINYRKDFESIMELQAHRHVVTKPTNYSRILYSYYVRCLVKYKDAARVMYQYGKKVEAACLNFDNFQKAMTEVATSYLTSMNTLKLLEPDDAWFYYVNIFNDDDEGRALKKRKKDDGTSGNCDKLEMINIQKIRQDYTLSMARLELGHHQPLEEVRIGNVNEIVRMCSYVNKFDLAISVANAHNLAFDDIFANMTNKCAADLHTTKNEFSRTIQGSDRVKAWIILEKYLERYDKMEETQCRYRAVVLKTLLSISLNIKIPLFLKSFYKENYQDDYINILLNNNITYDAVEAAVHWIQKCTAVKDTQDDNINWDTIDKVSKYLEVLLSGGSEVVMLDERVEGFLKDLKKDLDNAIDKYFSK